MSEIACNEVSWNNSPESWSFLEVRARSPRLHTFEWQWPNFGQPSSKQQHCDQLLLKVLGNWHIALRYNTWPDPVSKMFQMMAFDPKLFSLSLFSNCLSNCQVASNKVSTKVKAISFAENGSYFVTAGNRQVLHLFWFFHFTLNEQESLKTTYLDSSILFDFECLNEQACQVLVPGIFAQCQIQGARTSHGKVCFSFSSPSSS